MFFWCWRYIAATLVIVVVISELAGGADLPTTTLGRRVDAYFTSFNSGDPAIWREFLQENLSAPSLEQRPIAGRMEVYSQRLAEWQSLTVKQVLLATDTSVQVLVQTGGGEWMSMLFVAEPGSQQKINSLAVEFVDPPAEFLGEALSEQEAIATAEGIIDSLAEQKAFSGTVLIAHNGKAILSRAEGYASIEHKAPNRIDTKFNLGSINKLFTKVAIAQLLQAGEVVFDAPIKRYLPDYPNKEAYEKVTIRHLLEMRGGIGDFFGPEFAGSPKDRFRSNADFIPLFASEPLHFEPGAQQEYSNGGYILLGAIIEAVTGKSYYEYVEENIFDPAGMRNTDSYEADEVVPNIAMGYTRRSDSGEDHLDLRQNIYSRPAKGSAAGGGYSTVEDLLQFTEALVGLKLLDARHTSWILSGELPETASDSARIRRQARLGAAGGAPGINGAIGMDGESGYTVIVLGNYDPPAAENLGMKLLQLFRRVRA